MASVAADHASQIDRDMKKLKESMKGITIRTAGFKKDHDNLARQIARFTVALIEAEALIATRRARGGANNGGRRGARGNGAAKNTANVTSIGGK